MCAFAIFACASYLLFLLIHNERLKWISLELFRPSSLLESCFLCMFEFRWILVMNFKREGRACTKNELNRRTYYSYRCLSSFSDEMERKRPFYVFDVTQWNGFKTKNKHFDVYDGFCDEQHRLNQKTFLCWLLDTVLLLPVFFSNNHLLFCQSDLWREFNSRRV